jgi:hypothetical protein
MDDDQAGDGDEHEAIEREQGATSRVGHPVEDGSQRQGEHADDEERHGGVSVAQPHEKGLGISQEASTSPEQESPVSG